MPASTPPARTRKKGSTGSTRTRSRKPARTPASATPSPESITNYTTALRWLYQHVDYERMRLVRYNQDNFNLSRMNRLLDKLGKPHQQLKVVHIAGTKGKGSTCAMLSHMLQACGYTVGQYTSPHLVDLRERITVNNGLVSYNDMATLFKRIAEAEQKLKESLTFFEILTAAAFKHFADQAVDVVVLETGLGGRLDSTNVVHPLATGVTHIGLDHTNILGKDVASIAREKAGIFKKNVPAISVEQDPEAAAVLREVAEKVGAPLTFTGNEIDFSYRFEANRELGPHTRVCLTTETMRYEHLPVPLRGEHQAHNCGLALALLDRLKNHDFELPEEKVIAGLAATKLPGRMEQVWSEPRVVIDGAHNAGSIQALIKALGAHISYDSLVMIFASGQDKDVRGMLNQVALGADKVIFTRAKANPRSVEPEDLMSQFNEISGKMAQTADTLADALKLAGRAVSREDLIVVTGSFFLAGEARKYFTDAVSNRKRGR